jgi:hypothetical protein
MMNRSDPRQIALNDPFFHTANGNESLLIEGSPLRFYRSSSRFVL